MIRRFPIALLLAMAFCLPGAMTALAESQVYVHFFVVPIPSQDGSSDEIAALRLKLAELAGGYTELGLANGGALQSDGQVITRRNIAYMVSASRDITADLEEYVPIHFPIEKPYILVWQATLNR
jgi:hypothetical protein